MRHAAVWDSPEKQLKTNQEQPKATKNQVIFVKAISEEHENRVFS